MKELNPFLIDKNTEPSWETEARENFLKYLAYKLIQNLATNGVELK